MQGYSIRAFAPKEHDVHIVPVILNIPALETMLFPTRIPYDGAQGPLSVEGKWYQFQKVSDFEIEHIPKSFYLPATAEHSKFTNVPLYGQNKINLEIDLR